jgi:NADH dehydrogenase
MSTPRHRQRVVIVGAGFAGFHAARGLARAARHTPGIEIVLVNPTDYVLSPALLPELAGGLLDPRRPAQPRLTAGLTRTPVIQEEP